jgi:DNA-binding NarL/FixJ family response regulator
MTDLSSLTPRERLVVEYTVQGFDCYAIGTLLGGLSHRTIEAHRQNAYRKLGVDNMVQLVRYVYGLNALDEARKQGAAPNEHQGI